MCSGYVATAILYSRHSLSGGKNGDGKGRFKYCFSVDHSGSMNKQDASRMISKVLQVFIDTMHGENIRIGYLAYS